MHVDGVRFEPLVKYAVVCALLSVRLLRQHDGAALEDPELSLLKRATVTGLMYL